MPSRLVGLDQDCECDAAEGFQQPFCGRLRGRPFRIARIQARQSFSLLPQLSPHHILQQGQHPQRNRQQPDQSRRVIVPCYI